MQFETWTKALAELPIDCVAVGVHDDGELTPEARTLDLRCREKLSRLLKRGDFGGKPGETWLLTDLEGLRADRVLLVGLGAKGTASKEDLSRKAWRRATVAAISAASRTRVTSLALALPRPALKTLSDERFGRAVAELAGNTLYRVNDLKSGKKPRPHALARIVVGATAKSAQAINKGFAQGGALASGAALMRNLANLPGNVCTPTYLGKTAEGLARTHKSLRVKVLGLAEIKREKMGCLLAVSQGSEEPPRFIVIEHRHPKAKNAPVVLVGKGITFDTGGISLKDPPLMDEMKFDMSGAACVIGTMNSVAELNLPLNVVGIVASCENMPDGRAIKPGDIVTSGQGLTVEILNTDAEGRLILCDALNYAKRFKPDVVIDMATLTGAIVVALGTHHTGVFSNNDALARELVDCGVAADDRAWHMPLTEEYGEQLKSNFADMANVAGRDGGSITAAAFLGKFTKDLTWAHMDIAGTAYQGGAGKGSTGRPSALLLEYLLRRAAAR
ncbi:MAG TPA: leucyl aminopeptidase [Steroidobacteraceae bacterium]|jgi:leucyl aminopeptidase|nr:leucyl aminopeptidase [Steroidobacteraceae bacterium]